MPRARPAATARLAAARTAVGLRPEADIDVGSVPVIDTHLAALLPAADDALAQAMRYALLGPGKRVRALLALAAGHEAGAPREVALALGCAVEMLHAASLVVDDLPAMDDAAQRRGRAATHRVHGEAVAMLAAIGLIAQAFAVVGGLASVPPAARAAMVQALARAIGAEGLCGGQLGDLAGAAGGGLDALHHVGRRKTGALFVAAVELGALAGGAGGPRRAQLVGCAQHVGLAFQVCDDLADAGEDDGRPTYVSVLGRGGAQAVLRQHVDAARAQLGADGGALDRLVLALFAAPLGPAARPDR